MEQSHDTKPEDFDLFPEADPAGFPQLTETNGHYMMDQINLPQEQYRQLPEL